MGKKHTNEMIDAKLSRKNIKIKRVDDYAGVFVAITWRCVVCSNEWTAQTCKVLEGDSFCLICSGFKLTNKDIDLKLTRAGKTIKRLGNYTTNKTPIDWQCLVCDYIWSGRPDCVANTDRGCIRCSGKQRLTNDVVDLRLSARDVERVGDYTSMNVRIDFRCLLCFNVWLARPSDILHSKSGCPKCSESKGEKVISRLLDSFGVQYEKEYSFTGCVNPGTGRLLRFDFYLPEYNMCIEFDGSQHFFPNYPRNDKQKALARFESLKKRDMIKNNFCEVSKIKLLRISYIDRQNVEKILRKVLKYE